MSPDPESKNFVGNLTLYQIKHYYSQNQQLIAEEHLEHCKHLAVCCNIQTKEAVSGYKDLMTQLIDRSQGTQQTKS